MLGERFNRDAIRFLPLAQRDNKLRIDKDRVLPTDDPRPLSAACARDTAELAQTIRRARQNGAPVVLAFGAHTIKNGLGPVLIHLLREGWLQHLATNGAGVIHDWEFAFQGESSEDVRVNVAEGKFGIWEETGFHINLAIILGARDRLGYGEAVGRLIADGRHILPSRSELLADVADAGKSFQASKRAGAAADVLAVMAKFDLSPGILPVAHPFAKYSIQAAAYGEQVPFTSHPMFGHDIIYAHPLSFGAAIGRAAERDFLSFADTISRLQNGVYLSVGSAVMSPMIFEKSLSMARNVAHRHGRRIDNFHIAVVDLAANRWDWSKGEPPSDTPEYYLRYCKTFSRMGGRMTYLQADNRDFLLTLGRHLAD